MAATIRDIKERTGLSLATISKYLNGGNVLPENRTAIENAINELHYEVNEIARGLVTKQTRTIGVIVYSIESMFNGVLLHHIGEFLREEGYGILICDSDNDPKREKENVRFLVNKKVDGIIVIPVSNDGSFLEYAKNSEVPVVLMDRAVDSSGYDCVRIDNRRAAAEAVKYLIDRGHEKIAVICSKVEYTGIERHRGYLDAMRDAGYETPEIYKKQGRHSLNYGYESMKELMQLDVRPTAVFLSNYELTLGAVMAVNELGFNCPDDISIIGFDDLILSQVVKPSITTIIQPMEEMCRSAVSRLLTRMTEKTPEMPLDIVLSALIKEGGSVKKI